MAFVEFPAFTTLLPASLTKKEVTGTKVIYFMEA